MLRQAVRLRLASRGQHILPECRLGGAWRLTQPSPPPTGRPGFQSVICASYSHASIHVFLVASALHFPVSTHLPWKPLNVFKNQNLKKQTNKQTWLFLPQSKKGLLCHSGEDINYYPLWVIILGCSLCAVSARLDGKGIFSMKPILFF